MQKDIKNNALNNILEPNQKKYPIKEFLVERSWLGKLAEKTNLNKRDQAQQDRIYQLRDKVFSQITQQIAKYYQAAIKGGDYHFAGMPEIERGISGWAEEKIWRLLVAIGEPEHWRVNPEPSYWEEAI